MSSWLRRSPAESPCDAGGNAGRTTNFVYFQFWASKKLAKIWQVPNFGGGRIGPKCFNQNFADRHVPVTRSTDNKTSRALIVHSRVKIYEIIHICTAVVDESEV